MAIWLEGIALVAIFIWDRLDSNKQHEETLAQLKLAQTQIEVAKDGVELQKAAMKQWIDINELEAGPVHIQANAAQVDLPIRFQIGNPTKLLMTLISAMFWVDLGLTVSTFPQCFGATSNFRPRNTLPLA